MRPFKPRNKHLSDKKKQKLKAQQEKSVAKIPKINLFF